MIDIPATIKQLCALLGHQVLVDGLFSSDPHPGNLLLLPDGRLGLIDFGQVKRLTTAQRYKIARIVVAVATDDEEALQQIARSSNLRTQNNVSVAGPFEPRDEPCARADRDSQLRTTPEFLLACSALGWTGAEGAVGVRAARVEG